MEMNKLKCRFKVFINLRVAGIQELIDPKDWHYVDSKSNSADNVTRDKTLAELAKPSSWSQGPLFLLYTIQEQIGCLPKCAVSIGY